MNVLMRISRFLILLFIVSSAACFGQTKLISFKSHGGSNKNFHLAMVRFPEDLMKSNFGQAPRPFVYCAKLDTVWYISQDTVVISTSDMCEKKCTNSKDWTPGRDTLYKHPLFSKKYELKLIKQSLKSNYYFKNPVDSIVFIGYDSKMELTNEKKEEGGFIVIDFIGSHLTIIAVILAAIFLIVIRLYILSTKNFNL